MADWKPGEIVVELAATRGTQPTADGLTEPYGPSCTQRLLKIFSATYRGRFAIADLANPGDGGVYASMPPIPGMHICVDVKRRTIRAVDPLQFPEHKATLDGVNKLTMEYQAVRYRPRDTSLIVNATATEIKTTLWELRGIVDDKQGVLVEGRLPQPEEILTMDGQLKVRQYEEALKVTHYDDGRPVKETLYASEEELDKMGKSPEQRVQTVPATGNV